VEFFQIPARDLDHHIVDRGLKARLGDARDRVWQIDEAVAESQLGRHRGQGIAGRLGGESRTARKPCVDFDDPVILGKGVEGILDIAFADDAEMAHGADGNRAQLVVFAAGEGLARGDNDALAGVDAHGIKIFHVADREAVVVLVADDLEFDLFPAEQVLLDQDLAGVAESLLRPLAHLLDAAADAGAEAAEGVGDADHHRIADLPGHALRLRDRSDRMAARHLDIDLAQLGGEEISVLGVHDRLDRGAEHSHAIAAQDPFALELDTAVERGLTAEAEQDAVRLFLFDHLLDEVGGHRQKVDLIGQVFGGLDSGDVGIDQDRPDALFLEGLDRLAPRIIEFARFADLEGGAPQNYHFFSH